MPSPPATLFTRLHDEHLRKLGFRKRAARSERATEGLHQGVVCYSSRFSTGMQYRFTIEFSVTHEEFFRSLRPNDKFPGLSERFMPLMTWRPTLKNSTIEKWWDLNGFLNKDAVWEDLIDTFERQGFPELEETRTLEGLAAFAARYPIQTRFRAQSWALKHLGRVEEARAVIVAALDEAPHENARWAVNMWKTQIDA